MAKKLSKAKARKMLKDKKVRGKKLTDKQRRYFGLIASGKVPTRLGDTSKATRRKLKIS